MSDMSEYLVDKMINEKPKQQEKPIYWTTQSGSKIKVCDLTQEHKDSIVKMLKKKKEFIDNWLEILK